MSLYVWIALLVGLVLALVWLVRWVMWQIYLRRPLKELPPIIVEQIVRAAKSDWLGSQGLLTIDGCTWAGHKLVRYPFWDVAPDLWGLYCLDCQEYIASGSCQEYISYDQGTLAR